MNNYSLLSTIRHASRFMLTISCLMIISYCFVFYSPSAHAMVDANKRTNPSSETLLLTQVSENNKLLAQGITALNKELSKEKPSQKRLNHIQAYIAKKHDNLSEQQTQVEMLLSEQLAHLKEKKTDKKLFSAGQKQTAKINDQYQLLLDDLTQLQGFKSANELIAKKAFVANLDSKLTRINRQAPTHSYDNDNLPFGPNSNQQTEAVLTQEALELKLNDGQPILQARSMLASVDLDLPSDADLAASVDAQLTDAIKQKAIELDSNPLTIYNWVYNNIRYLPSHGSMQGADYTLLSGQGNAIDSASLLVALLRSTATPARYVYGSVSLSPEQLQNWVGGVDNWEATANLLGQGGIPVTQVFNQNGQIAHIAIEHAWVEAWIDNKWVSLDPSFKQYQYTERMQLEQAVPFNASSLQDMLTNGSESNESEGWVRGIDQEAISNQLTQYQAKLEEFMSINHPSATLAEVLGSQKIIQTEADTLPTTLPYIVIHAEKSVSTLPDSLRLKYKFNLLDEYGTNLISYEASGPEVAGKRHALSYKPATESDQQRLLDYLPEEINSAADLPGSLPINLINLTPEWVVEGQTIKSASAVGLGVELKVQQGFYLPGRGWEMGLTSPTNAGAYQAVGIDLQGIAPKQLQALQAELEETKGKLEAEDFENIDSHDLTGNILQTGVLSYFAMTYAQDKLAAQVADSVSYRQPSYGTFGIAGSVSYWFGLPRNIAFTGVVMDIDNLAFSSEVKSNCHGDWVALNKASGVRASAYEHIIPEIMFNTDPANPVEGISAVKALTVAAQQNQKIYTLDLGKIDQLANISIDSAAKNEIRNALYQGKTVTVHEKPITHFGWTGSGYIVTDNDTGAGAYKISGGSNGGFLNTINSYPLIWAALSFAVAFIPFIGPILAIGAGILSIAASFQDFEQKLNGSSVGCLIGGGAALISFGVILLVIGAFASLLAVAIAFSIGAFLIDSAIKAVFTEKTCLAISN
ncbi:MAG: hypothetical protein ACJAZP_002854 [Psychromonas sp.]|jgi:hypothetical protein|uniref:transglutaminase-like domain-containing protein n=1 Tax=Psychromonas sp. TaxID=1884585 RepID=UPI0039E5B779